MQHQFAQVPRAEIPRSTFDRSHGHKTTFDAGLLIPILFDEALPGDTFKLRSTIFARLATPIFPIMDNMYLDVHYFAVPVRLLWENWARMNGEQDNPDDSTDFLVPVVTPPALGFTADSLFDYMGIPTGIANGPTPVSALFARAYARIYKDWYRDQNLIDSPTISVDDGPDLASEYTIFRRGKRHDYFTSCLPWPQKGPGVSIPLGTAAPIKTSATHNLVTGANPAMYMTRADGNLPTANVVVGVSAGGTGNTRRMEWGQALTGADGLGVFPSNLYADLELATAATINSLRQAFQIQKIYERDARGGTRLIELIKAHFGVTSPDARMQRPEYLGGGSTPVNIAPVAQTSSTDAETPQGNLSAFGTALASGNGFTMSFTEHCIIVGIASVRADLTYQQGLNRMFSRRTRFDFYWPALAHIGEQAVLNKEIYADGSANDDEPFGYNERHADYRYKPSIITGRMRSAHAQSLDAWHLSQEFANLPVLDQEFIEEDPPVDRVIAVPAEPHFIVDMYFSMHCTRPMPVYGTPGLIDHF